jgi:hypothetical protein
LNGGLRKQCKGGLFGNKIGDFARDEGFMAIIARRSWCIDNIFADWKGEMADPKGSKVTATADGAGM